MLRDEAPRHVGCGPAPTTRYGTSRADRLAFLVDGAAYFDAFMRGASRAERSLLIVGWDLDSRVLLDRDAPDGGARLGRFFADLVREKPLLHAHALIWDFAPFYLLDREALTGL